MGGLLKLISKLYGKNALAKTIGTRTNVIKLPTNDTKKFIKRELDIENASDAAVEKAYKDIQELIPEIPKMNDAERLIFEGNLRRLDNRMNPPSAEVIEFGTKQKVGAEGVESLRDQLGIPSDVDPNSPLGRVMTRTKQIQKQGKDLAKEFGMEDQLKKGLQDLMQEQKGMSKLYTEGLVRATVREIVDRDIKSGRIKLPEMEEDIIRFGSQGDPIDIFRKYYGEDALEQVDSITPKLRELRTSSEAADLATKEFTFEPKLDRPPGSFDPENPPEFATGGRVGYQAGGAATPEQFRQAAMEVVSGGLTPQLVNQLRDYNIGYYNVDPSQIQTYEQAVASRYPGQSQYDLYGGGQAMTDIKTKRISETIDRMIQDQISQARGQEVSEPAPYVPSQREIASAAALGMSPSQYVDYAQTEGIDPLKVYQEQRASQGTTVPYGYVMAPPELFPAMSDPSLSIDPNIVNTEGFVDYNKLLDLYLSGTLPTPSYTESGSAGLPNILGV